MYLCENEKLCLYSQQSSVFVSGGLVWFDSRVCEIVARIFSISPASVVFIVSCHTMLYRCQYLALFLPPLLYYFSLSLSL